jgi:hypothetical protein
MSASWPGFSETDTLVLPLQEAPPAGPVEIDGRRFEPKAELHVTLVGSALGRELRATLGERLDAAVRPAFEALDWSYARTRLGALIEKTGRRDDGRRGPVASIIEFIELPAMPHLHRWLGELLGRELPVPPPHVTLYTHACGKGIGIPSMVKLRAWTRRRLSFDEHGLIHREGAASATPHEPPAP